MAQVDGIGPADGPRKILGESLRRMAKVEPQRQDPVDQVEISPEARDMAALSEVPGIRHELVQRVRQEIAAGTYETDRKWEVAFPRLLRAIFSDAAGEQPGR